MSIIQEIYENVAHFYISALTAEVTYDFTRQYWQLQSRQKKKKSIKMGTSTPKYNLRNQRLYYIFS